MRDKCSRRDFLKTGIGLSAAALMSGGKNLLGAEGNEGPMRVVASGNGLRATEKAMEFLLRNRHLAPSYGSVHYLPAEEDELIIKKIPDMVANSFQNLSGDMNKLYVTEHKHKSGENVRLYHLLLHLPRN